MIALIKTMAKVNPIAALTEFIREVSSRITFIFRSENQRGITNTIFTVIVGLVAICTLALTIYGGWLQKQKLADDAAPNVRTQLALSLIIYTKYGLYQRT
jgi:hypothetical protein